jgi:hypothetical protein
VARLAPIPERNLSLMERVRRLEDSGQLEPLSQEMRHLPPPLPLKRGLAQQWLQNDRDA